MKEYETIQGDTWDIIAKRVYGNEIKADVLMDANRDLLSVLVFDDGVTIKCPDIGNENPASETYPEWRK